MEYFLLRTAFNAVAPTAAASATLINSALASSTTTRQGVMIQAYGSPVYVKFTNSMSAPTLGPTDFHAVIPANDFRYFGAARSVQVWVQTTGNYSAVEFQ